MVKLPHGLYGYDNIEDALAAAKAGGKKVFVDITGHGCVNCREMEARVWSDPQVLERLQGNFVLVALYTDDKAKLPESSWITTPDGKTLKDVGRVNSYIARTRFGVNAQPNYFILDADGKILAGPRGYDLSVPGFIDFLDLK
ncbi:MAG: thioredoxin family protein [Bacteroidales bacterium]|nr:thioredoxin family protein [Bacteroidales bacterium]